MRLPSPPLILITDRKQARRPLPDVVGAALAAGCRWVSLREKDLPPDEQVALAQRLLPLAQRHGASLTLHGDPVLALEGDLGGVHLGAGSDPSRARAQLGPDRLVGVSVHTAEDAVALDPANADYAVAGPAFLTASKPGYGPALGLKGIAAIVRASRVPVLAVGGVEAENAPGLLAAGAAGLAVMGGVMRAIDPGAEIERLLAALPG